jgi:hypothetical protein
MVVHAFTHMLDFEPDVHVDVDEDRQHARTKLTTTRSFLSTL